MSSAESQMNLNLALSTEAQQTIGVIAVAEEEEIARLTVRCASMERELAKWDVKEIAAISASQLARLLEQDSKMAGETQIQRYERRHAPKPILDIIRRGGGPAMGAQMERVFRAQWKSLLPRESKKATGKLNTGYDHRVDCGGWKLLEQKTSGLWSDEENDFHWQHIEVAHPWNGLLLVGIGIGAIHAWGMTRANFEACVADGRATNQGNKEKNSSEGVWMTYKNVRDCLVPLLSEEDLLAFVSTL